MTYNLEGSSIDRLKAAGFKRPCGVTDLSSENALLLEFETGVDAATAKVFIRSQAPADLCSRDKNSRLVLRITKKLDIFSLRMIIIEIMTGRKDYPLDETETSSQQYIELVRELCFNF